VHLPLIAFGQLEALPQVSQLEDLGPRFPGLALDGGLGGWAAGAGSLGIADTVWHLWAAATTCHPAQSRQAMNQH
jgi:hypothetical protein